MATPEDRVPRRQTLYEILEGRRRERPVYAWDYWQEDRNAPQERPRPMPDYATGYLPRELWRDPAQEEERLRREYPDLYEQERAKVARAEDEARPRATTVPRPPAPPPGELPEATLPPEPEGRPSPIGESPSLWQRIAGAAPPPGGRAATPRPAGSRGTLGELFSGALPEVDPQERQRRKTEYEARQQELEATRQERWDERQERLARNRKIADEAKRMASTYGAVTSAGPGGERTADLGERLQADPTVQRREDIIYKGAIVGAHGIGRLVAEAGEELGSTSMTELGYRWMTKADESQAPASGKSWDELETMADYIEFGLDQVAQGAGSMAPTMAGALIGGAVGSVAGPGGAAVGGAIGGALAGFPMMYDEIAQALEAEGLDGPGFEAVTVLGALVNTALEIIIPARIARRMTGAEEQLVRRGVAAGVAATVKEVGLDAGGEALTEFVQQQTVGAATAVQSGGEINPFLTPDHWVDSFIGAGVGAILGGGGGIVSTAPRFRGSIETAADRARADGGPTAPPRPPIMSQERFDSINEDRQRRGEPPLTWKQIEDFHAENNRRRDAGERARINALSDEKLAEINEIRQERGLPPLVRDEGTTEGDNARRFIPSEPAQAERATIYGRNKLSEYGIYDATDPALDIEGSADDGRITAADVIEWAERTLPALQETEDGSWTWEGNPNEPYRTETAALNERGRWWLSQQRQERWQGPPAPTQEPTPTPTAEEGPAPTPTEEPVSTADRMAEIDRRLEEAGKKVTAAARTVLEQSDIDPAWMMDSMVTSEPGTVSKSQAEIWVQRWNEYKQDKAFEDAHPWPGVPLPKGYTAKAYNSQAGINWDIHGPHDMYAGTVATEDVEETVRQMQAHVQQVWGEEPEPFGDRHRQAAEQAEEPAQQKWGLEAWREKWARAALMHGKAQNDAVKALLAELEEGSDLLTLHSTSAELADFRRFLAGQEPSVPTAHKKALAAALAALDAEIATRGQRPAPQEAPGDLGGELTDQAKRIRSALPAYRVVLEDGKPTLFRSTRPVKSFESEEEAWHYAARYDTTPITEKARIAALDSDVDIVGLKGSGKNGRILVSDVRAAAAAQPAPETQTEPEEAPGPPEGPETAQEEPQWTPQPTKEALRELGEDRIPDFWDSAEELRARIEEMLAAADIVAKMKRGKKRKEAIGLLRQDETIISGMVDELERAYGGNAINKLFDPRTPDFLPDYEAELGNRIPEIDVAVDRTPADKTEPMPPRTDIYEAPEETVNADKVATETGEVLSAEEAQARIDSWKAEADRQRESGVNANKVIISLYDRTGVWSEPYARAGYRVLTIDAANDQDIFALSPEAIIDAILKEVGPDAEIVGVLSAPPCTSFSSSGARWWENRHDLENPDVVEELYGWQARKMFDTPLEAAKFIVYFSDEVVSRARQRGHPVDFYALENPVGRIASETGLPDPLLRFNPNNYGDPYTKQTNLWGHFNPDLPQANVAATEGSKIHKLRGDVPKQKALRSVTPEGFAYAFFMANSPAVETVADAEAVVEVTGENAERFKGAVSNAQFLVNNGEITIPAADLDYLHEALRKEFGLDWNTDVMVELFLSAMDQQELAKVSLTGGARFVTEASRTLLAGEDYVLPKDMWPGPSREAWAKLRDDMEAQGYEVMQQRTKDGPRIRARKKLPKPAKGTKLVDAFNRARQDQLDFEEGDLDSKDATQHHAFWAGIQYALEAAGVENPQASAQAMHTLWYERMLQTPTSWEEAQVVLKELVSNPELLPKKLGDKIRDRFKKDVIKRVRGAVGFRIWDGTWAINTWEDAVRQEASQVEASKIDAAREEVAKWDQETRRQLGLTEIGWEAIRVLLPGARAPKLNSALKAYRDSVAVLVESERTASEGFLRTLDRLREEREVREAKAPGKAARDLKPMEDKGLRYSATPVTGAKSRGNIGPEGVITNGHFLYRLRDVIDKKKKQAQKLHDAPPTTGGKTNEKAVGQVWDRALEKATRAAKFLGWRKRESEGYPYLVYLGVEEEDGTKTVRAVDGKYFRIMYDHLAPDSYKAGDEMDAIVFFRDGEPVGLVMPLRHAALDDPIDVNLAWRLADGEEVTEADIEEDTEGGEVATVGRAEPEPEPEETVVTDENGEPVIFLHGTPSKWEGMNHDLSQDEGENLGGPGAYFTTRERADVASSYAEETVGTNRGRLNGERRVPEGDRPTILDQVRRSRRYVQGTENIDAHPELAAVKLRRAELEQLFMDTGDLSVVESVAELYPELAGSDPDPVEAFDVDTWAVEQGLRRPRAPHAPAVIVARLAIQRPFDFDAAMTEDEALALVDQLERAVPPDKITTNTGRRYRVYWPALLDFVRRRLAEGELNKRASRLYDRGTGRSLSGIDLYYHLADAAAESATRLTAADETDTAVRDRDVATYVLQALGYDGLTFEEGYEGDTYPVWVAFNSDQILPAWTEAATGGAVSPDDVQGTLGFSVPDAVSYATRADPIGRGAAPASAVTEALEARDQQLGRERIGPGSLQGELDAQEGVEPISRREVMRKIAKIAEVAGKMVPIRTGRIAMRRALGVFKVGPEVIRLRHALDLPTAAHEMAHATEKVVFGWPKGGPWKKPRVSAKMQAELVALGKALYGNEKPAGGYKREGFAEFWRRWFENDPELVNDAPEFYRWFEDEFLGANDAMRKAAQEAREAMDRWQRQGSVNRVRESIVDTASPRERLRRTVQTTRRLISMDTLVEMAQPLYELAARAEKQLGHKLSAAENPFTILSALRQTHATRTRYMVERHMIDLAGNPVGPALESVRKLIKGQQRNFAAFLYAKRAVALWTDPQGAREPGITLQDAQRVIEELGSPEFERAAAIVYAWADGTLDYAAQASPIFAEVVKRVRARDPGNYVPLQRIFHEIDENIRRARGRENVSGSASPVARLTGAMRDIKDPLATLIGQTESLIAASHRRLILDKIIALANVEGMGDLIEEVPRDKVPALTRTIGGLIKRMNQELRDTGAEVILDTEESDYSEDDLAEMLVTFWAPATFPKGVDPVVAVHTGAGIKWYYIDPRLYDVMGSLDIARLDDIHGMFRLVEATLGRAARAMRAGTTGLRASFGLLWNPLRDIQTMSVNSQAQASTPRMVGYWLKAMFDIATFRLTPREATAFVDAAIRTGVEMAQPLGQDIPHTRLTVRRMHQGRLVRTLDPRNWLEFYRDLVQFPELAPRVAEFQAVARDIGWEPGTPMSLEQSLQMLLAAKQVTTDFTAAGSISRFINRLVPFHNAAIQGPRANLRAARRNPYKFVWRGLQLMALTWLLWWRNRDKEWYRTLPYRDRYMHWWMEGPGDELIRIPRAFEVGMVFAALPEMLLDQWYTQDPEGASAWFQTFWETSRPPFVGVERIGGIPVPIFENPVVEEGFQQAANRDFFFDRPLVPMGEERKPNEEQYNEWTSRAAIVLGDMFNMSPRRIDHAIQGVFGYVGGDLLDLLGLGPPGVDRESEPADWPVIGRIFRRGGETGSRSKQIDDLYDRLEEAQLRQASTRTPETPEQRQARLMLTDAARAVTALTYVRSRTGSREQRRRLTQEAQMIADSALAAIERPADEAARAPFRAWRREAEDWKEELKEEEAANR